jgi:hypothetical protein
MSKSYLTFYRMSCTQFGNSRDGIRGGDFSRLYCVTGDFSRHYEPTPHPKTEIAARAIYLDGLYLAD